MKVGVEDIQFDRELPRHEKSLLAEAINAILDYLDTFGHEPTHLLVSPKCYLAFCNRDIDCTTEYDQRYWQFQFRKNYLDFRFSSSSFYRVEFVITDVFKLGFATACTMYDVVEFREHIFSILQLGSLIGKEELVELLDGHLEKKRSKREDW